MDNDEPFDLSDIVEDEDGYIIVPQTALRFLPPEWQAELQRIADTGQAVLKSVDKQLNGLIALIRASVNLVSLKHVDKRLRDYQFEPTMDAILELEMLTTAFAVIYVRLHHGSRTNAGFERGELPPNLHAAHDELIEIRNKRYAHNDEHHSVENAIEVGFEDNKFSVRPEAKLGYYIGGALTWHEIVDFVDALYYNKMAKAMSALSAKTGYEWTWPHGPAPSDA